MKNIWHFFTKFIGPTIIAILSIIPSNNSSIFETFPNCTTQLTQNSAMASTVMLVIIQAALPNTFRYCHWRHSPFLVANLPIIPPVIARGQRHSSVKAMTNGVQFSRRRRPIAGGLRVGAFTRPCAIIILRLKQCRLTAIPSTKEVYKACSNNAPREFGANASVPKRARRWYPARRTRWHVNSPSFQNALLVLHNANGKNWSWRNNLLLKLFTILQNWNWYNLNCSISRY